METLLATNIIHEGKCFSIQVRQFSCFTELVCQVENRWHTIFPAVRNARIENNILIFEAGESGTWKEETFLTC